MGAASQPRAADVRACWPLERPNTASAADSLRFFVRVVLPTLAKGVLLRRRWGMSLAARLDLDAKAVRLMQRLRRTYGGQPLLLRNPIRPQAVLLSYGDVAFVLSGAPEPFSPASKEKRAALAHFEPHASLVTLGKARQNRRAFHDDVLESANPVHSMGRDFAAVVRDEAAWLLSNLQDGSDLTWEDFSQAWFKAVRTLVLGPGARDDHALTDMLSRLRANANWVFARRPRRALIERYHDCLQRHIARAESGSLAALMARRPAVPGEARSHQVTQWLFAFDAGGIATFRALALLISSPEAAAADLERYRAGEIDLPFLRACFLEAVRLWPTTPFILRETTQPVQWGSATLPAGTGIAIYAPFFHRDTERLADCESFRPERWIGRDPETVPPFVPFSAGPAVCPGRHVETLVASLWLAALLDSGALELRRPAPFEWRGPMPATLDHFSICFSSRWVRSRAS